MEHPNRSRFLLLGAFMLLANVGSRGSTPWEPSSNENVKVSGTILAWDRTEQEQTMKTGQSVAHFDFTMTNSSSETVEVQKINTSCGCTSLAGRTVPFKLKAGDNEKLSFRMNLVGKSGKVTKSIFVITDHGTKTLLVTANCPSQSNSDQRTQNQALAKADRQAIFHGDCASCHQEPTEGRMGAELYHAACAICHEAEHRATMVPDLAMVAANRDATYWRSHIINGREGTLMPAFANDKGGILSPEQIDSLVGFLLSHPPAPQARQIVAPQWIPYPGTDAVRNTAARQPTPPG